MIFIFTISIITISNLKISFASWNNIINNQTIVNNSPNLKNSSLLLATNELSLNSRRFFGLPSLYGYTHPSNLYIQNFSKFHPPLNDLALFFSPSEDKKMEEFRNFYSRDIGLTLKIKSIKDECKKSVQIPFISSGDEIKFFVKNNSLSNCDIEIPINYSNFLQANSKQGSISITKSEKNFVNLTIPPGENNIKISGESDIYTILSWLGDFLFLFLFLIWLKLKKYQEYE